MGKSGSERVSGESSIFFFFFQAEDGIRDLIVTGVQTCALPILARYEGDGRDSGKLAYEPGHRRELVAAAGVDREDERVHPLPPGRPQRVPERAKIGRASCRERV